MKLIEKWLSGSKNFYTGKALYTTFGKDENLLRLLEKGPAIISQQLLEKALDEINRLPEKPVIAKETAPMPDSPDQVLQAIKNEWMLPYQAMNFKRHRLQSFGKNNWPEQIMVRKELAFEILALEQECMRIWAKRDYYLKYGKLPDQQEQKLIVPTDPVELGKKIEAVKRRIRDWKKKSQNNPEDPKAIATYEQYKDQYKILTGELYEEVNHE